jgi:hypothetical protein
MKSVIFVLLAIAALFIQATTGLAYEGILRPYQSTRSAALGGVRLTTGLYEENFFNNPARVTANPTWRFNLPDPMVEINTNTTSTASDLAGNDALSGLADTAGDVNHGRFQMTFPSIFIPAGDLSFAFGIITSIQADVQMARNFNAVTKAVADVGAAFTVGYKALEDKSLSLGTTLHIGYRGTSPTEKSVADILRNPSQIFSTNELKSGGTIDIDLGATYVLPFKIDEIDFSVAGAINNVFGGKYNRFAVRKSEGANPIDLPPPDQPRTLGVGFLVHQPHMWVFTDPLLALEFTDIGNNPDGSMFKTVHLGFELHHGVLSPRVGINQGYLTAGLGLDLPVLSLDLATYGEETSLNVGGIEDRRIALRLGLHI